MRALKFIIATISAYIALCREQASFVVFLAGYVSLSTLESAILENNSVMNIFFNISKEAYPSENFAMIAVDVAIRTRPRAKSYPAEIS